MTPLLKPVCGPRQRPPAVIRRAVPDDAETLARIGAQTFAATFGHLYPADDLAAFLTQAHSPEAALRNLERPDTAAWLAEAEGEAVGHALAGPCGLPHHDVTPTCGELKRLYLVSDAQGGGLGRRLMTQALDWLEATGRSRIWIGVWSGNHNAQRLYARAGFEKVGEYEFVVGSVRDHEFILRRG
jgi:GNAT superfamily N-acetyltransferase